MSRISESVVVVIPAFNPGQELLTLLAELARLGLDNILLVNDGSADDALFRQAADALPVTLLVHPQNRGKGAALKTAFRHVLSQPDCAGIKTLLTVDADGQHLPQDVLNLAQQAQAEPDVMILGKRDFSRGAQQEVPVKSLLGNRLTRHVLSQAADIQLQDTQTGLRAIPVALGKRFLDLPGSHYEFELECLVLAHQSGWAIREVPIATVYEDNNSASHFNPFLDSLRIYAVFTRFLSISLASFVIDIVLFALLHGVSGQVYLSTYGSRSCSALFNFCGNKLFVFKSRGRARLLREVAGYVLLVAASASLSAILVSIFHAKTGGNILFVKIVVDAFIFFLNFTVQRLVLFRRREPG